MFDDKYIQERYANLAKIAQDEVEQGNAPTVQLDVIKELAGESANSPSKSPAPASTEKEGETETETESEDETDEEETASKYDGMTKQEILDSLAKLSKAKLLEELNG